MDTTEFPGSVAGMTTQELVQAALPAYKAPTTYSEIIRDEVKAEAARRGISQRRLSSAMGISQQSISDRWRGRIPWTLDEVERLEPVLGLTRGALLMLCARRDSNPQPSDLSPLKVAILATTFTGCGVDHNRVTECDECRCYDSWRWARVDGAPTAAAAWELAA